MKVINDNIVPVLYYIHVGQTIARGSEMRLQDSSHTAGFINYFSASSWISAINHTDVNVSITLVEGSQSAYEVQ